MIMVMPFCIKVVVIDTVITQTREMCHFRAFATFSRRDTPSMQKGVSLLSATKVGAELRIVNASCVSIRSCPNVSLNFD